MIKTFRIGQAVALSVAMLATACSSGTENNDQTGPAASAEQLTTTTSDDASTKADADPAYPAAFTQCAACHRVEADAPAAIGPHLVGIVSSSAASRSDFKYSPALSGSGIVWDEQTLDAFLANPQSVVPGTMMAFGGIADEAQRKEIIDYLATLQ